MIACDAWLMRLQADAAEAIDRRAAGLDRQTGHQADDAGRR